MMMNEVGEELFHFCYGYQIYLIFFFLFIYKQTKSTQYLSEFLLRPYLDYSQTNSILQLIILTLTQTFVFPDYALFSNHNCGHVRQSMWGSLTICFFIISYLYIVISTQTSRYLVGYLPVKSTAWLLGDQRNAKPNTSTNSVFAELQTYFLNGSQCLKPINLTQHSSRNSLEH